MNILTAGKIQIGLGMALAALALTAGCASTTAEADESLGEAEGALVTTVPPRTQLSCSMSSPGATGRRKAILVVDDDLMTCTREAVPGNCPAATTTPSCHELGRMIGCENIITLQ